MAAAPTSDDSVRRAGRHALAAALAASRRDTLATFAAYEAAGALQVPLRPTLNPPLWELGHIGWFQELWIGRNPERERGIAADPDAPRRAHPRPQADALYDSSRVPHDRRWSLPLPDAAATREALAAQLEQTLQCLQNAGDSDDALYFFRLVLMHEDMHHEAAVYMARSLGLRLPDPRWLQPDERGECVDIAVPAGTWQLGSDGPGFAFDNELCSMPVPLAAYAIDCRPVTWAEFEPFVASGGYDDGRWWSEPGRRWRMTAGARRPAGPAAQAAAHLSFFEAEAWCAWAGRRLPSEAEWERAAVERPDTFAWGHVWEWTASEFAPFPGFRPHPYREYSAPWFDGRPVLRGASCATQPRLRDPRYRNFFTPERTDIIAGFRSCAVTPLEPPR